MICHYSPRRRPQFFPPAGLAAYFAIAIAASFAGHGALAQQESPSGAAQSPKNFVPVPLFDPATISEHTLPNGVRGVVKQTRGSGVVAVQVWVRAGSRYEVRGNFGVSHLVETLVGRASRLYPASEGGPSDAIQALGGDLNSDTERDSANYSIVVAPPFLPNAIHILADATLHPRMSDTDVSAAKMQSESDLQRRLGDPIATLADIAYYMAFSKHPYRNPAGGTIQSIEGLTGPRVRSYFADRYVGRNISVVVVGDIDPAAAHKLIAQYFSEAVKASTPDETIAPEAAPAVFRTATRRTNVARGAVALAFRAPGMNNPRDVVAMDVLLSYWNDGQDAVLRKILLGSDTGDDSPAASVNNTAAAAIGVRGMREIDAVTPDAQTAPSAPAPGTATPGGAAPEAASPGAAAPNSAGPAATAPTGPAPGGATPAAPTPAPPEPLAIAFDASFLTQHDPSLLVVSLVLDPASRSRAVDAVLHQVAQVRTTEISAASLAAAKHELISQYVEQGETVSGQAGALGFYEMIGNYQFATTYLQRVQEVTAADIKRVAQRYLSSTIYVQVAIVPSQRATPPRTEPPLNGGDSGGVAA